MTLAIILCVGVSHKVQTIISFALTTASLICRIMLLSSGAAVLLSLSRLVIIRLGVLGTIRVSVLNQSHHQLSHVIAVALEPTQLPLKRRKPAILLQHYDR